MKKILRTAGLIGLLAPVASFGQTTLAGWSFSQFVSEGTPQTDINSVDPVNFIVATYRGNFNPVSAQVDGSMTQSNGNSYVNTSFGTWEFSDFNINNAVDVRADNVGSLNTVNSTTLDGKFMHLTDAGSKVLTFNATNTLWTITVQDTAAYTNVAGSDNDFTFAATTASGATIEWLYNGNVFATNTVVAPDPNGPPYSSYGFDFANQGAAFYSTGVIQGRLVSGSVKFDNVQVNGTAIPEASSFAALAGLAGLAFASSRRRRV